MLDPFNKFTENHQDAFSRAAIPYSISSTIDPDKDMDSEQPIEQHEDFGVRDAMICFYLPQKRFKVERECRDENGNVIKSEKIEKNKGSSSSSNAANASEVQQSEGTGNFMQLNSTPLAKKRRDMQANIMEHMEGPDMKKQKK